MRCLLHLSVHLQYPVQLIVGLGLDFPLVGKPLFEASAVAMLLDRFRRPFVASAVEML